MSSVARPEILDRLIARLGELRPDTPRRWGTMTSGEMLCHLADVASNVLGAADSGPGRPRPVFKWIGLYSPLPWPHGMRTPRRVDPRLEGSRPGDFEEDRRRAVEGLRALAAASVLPASHSVFGTMTVRDWHRWAYRHTRHHLRQFGL